MPRPIYQENVHTRQRTLERSRDTLMRRGPGAWIEVGGTSYAVSNNVADPSFTPPPYQNNFASPSATIDPLQFRHAIHGEVEFRGTVDVSAALSNDIAFTLPDSYQPTRAYAVIKDVRKGSTWEVARFKVATTGDVTIEFPVGSTASGDWVSPDFINGWVNPGLPYATTQYRMGVSGLEFKGHLTGGASGTIAFYLLPAWVPTRLLSTATDVIKPGTPGVAQLKVTEGTGAVTITRIL